LYWLRRTLYSGQLQKGKQAGCEFGELNASDTSVCAGGWGGRKH
jgi:hypothetical protein